MPQPGDIGKGRSIVGLAGGALLVVSSLAHAFFGWPAMSAALETAGVADEGLLGALAAGWHFGSVAMMIFGVIVLSSAAGTLRGKPAATSPVLVIALGYLLFGVAAYWWRNFNPHFLAFIATGVILGIFAFPKRS